MTGPPNVSGYPRDSFELTLDFPCPQERRDMSERMAAISGIPTARSATQPMSLADQAFQVLRDRLVVLDIAPGEPLNDEQIGHELGFGRTPVREALKRLESEHLVTVFPRRGTFAAAVDITDLGGISEIRAQLEPLVASRSARFASAGARAEMHEIADHLIAMQQGDIEASQLIRLDLRVHRLIYASNGNRHLEEVLVRYDDLATRVWCAVLDRLPRIDSHVGEHVELLRAIADGDDERAAAGALEHVLAFERLVRTVL
jgi:DNA-binding GntR family transcriptional regulator